MKEEMEIVLIEDNEDDALRMIKFLRSNFSNKITCFHDGADAAEFLLFNRDRTRKLILLDLVLPSVDGLELYKIIEAEPKERRLDVVMLVSSERTIDYLKSIDVHPAGFLTKPSTTHIPARVA